MVSLFLTVSALGAQYEIGVNMGYVFYAHDGDFEHSKHDNRYWRPNLYFGYQFNSLSDQLTLTLTSDHELDEAQLGYAFVLPSLRDYMPFASLFFVAPKIGLGNAYRDKLTLTEFSYGLGLGCYKQLGDYLRVRFEIDYVKRGWQVSRRGRDDNAIMDDRNSDDHEFGAFLGIGLTF